MSTHTVDSETLDIIAAGVPLPMAHRLAVLEWRRRMVAAEDEGEFLRDRLAAVTADLKSAAAASEARRLRLYDAERKLAAVRDAALAASLKDETDIAALVKQCDMHRAEINRLRGVLHDANQGRT